MQLPVYYNRLVMVIIKMAKSIFAMRLVTDLGSVTCYGTDENRKGKFSFRSSKSWFKKKV